MKSSFLIVCALLAMVYFINPNPVNSQSISQVVKGKVFDTESQSTLPGANVVIMNTNPLLGSTSDMDGNFKISNVPIGRYNIQISYLGYEPVVIPEVLVTSGKEVVLNIGLKQSINQMSEITVNANSLKDRPLNNMATISARSFTVEETRRYAGGLDDPARMASAFAGVTVGNLQDNAIMVRGNSPKGVSWRLEGVEIPNPNHFAGGNVAGGGFVTIFSGQLLSNSDFFTGAFPAEYGNVLAGVFDMKLRTGNSEKREHTFQAGLLGFDFSSEGPFVKGKNATYLFNYRYSTFGLLTALKIIPSEQIPMYQDLSFKLNFPTKKAGSFSIWGIGGIDNNIEPNDKDSTKWESDWDRIWYNWHIYTGATGLSHKIMLNKQSYINTTISASGIRNKMDQTRLDNDLIERPNAYMTDYSGKFTFNSFINQKLSSRHTVKAGFTYNRLFYNINLNGTADNNPMSYMNFVKENGQTDYVELYAQSKYDINEFLSLNAGINFNRFVLNTDYSIDPRIGMRWEFTPGHAFGFGYGKHSQLEELKIYLINQTENDKTIYPNKNLKMSHAQHLVFSYDWRINNNLRMKIEPYFQYLYDVPGIKDSSYSMINFKQDWTFREKLTNCSNGKNIGVDLTFERFLNNNYYFLLTTSIFSSKFKGDDGVWRNSRYNKGYVVNFLAGKEFFLKKNRILGLNGRLNYMGGERESPLMLEKSMQLQTEIYDNQNAFGRQLPPMYYMDLSVTYRTNKKKYSGTWALQVKNILGSPLQEGEYYNYKTKKIENSETVIVVPVISYKIEF